MREIKFRAWDIIRKEMFAVSALTYSRVYDEYYINGPGKYAPRDETILMQYTGLKDMNGVEIYEGDIVKETVKLIRGKKQSTFYVVRYVNGMFQYKQPLAYGHEYLEVVGNIHENPELIP